MTQEIGGRIQIFIPYFYPIFPILEFSYILGVNFRPEPSNLKVIYMDNESGLLKWRPFNELSATIPHCIVHISC